MNHTSPDNHENPNTPNNICINESTPNHSETSATLASTINPPAEATIACTSASVKSFSSSFKHVSPLNLRPNGTSNIIIKPVALKQQAPFTASQQESLPFQFKFKTAFSSSSSLEQEKENLSVPQLSQQQSQQQLQQQPLSIPGFLNKSSGFRVSSVVRSPIPNQVNSKPVVTLFKQATTTSFEEQFFLELQKSIEIELQQHQHSFVDTSSIEFPFLTTPNPVTPTLLSNSSTVYLGSANESVTKTISSEMSLDKQTSKKRRAQKPSNKLAITKLKSKPEETEEGVSSPCLVKKSKCESQKQSCVNSQQQLQPTYESEESAGLLPAKSSDCSIKSDSEIEGSEPLLQEQNVQQQQNDQKTDIEVEGEEAAASIPQIRGSEDMVAEGEMEKKTRVCNCKKTKCLKLYCDCFAAGEFCGADCNCCECSNTVQNKEARNKIVESLLEKNPYAFHVKDIEIEDVSQLSLKAQKKLASKKGCNCRRSGCQKKYCQCYQDGLQCGEHCKCSGCENCEKPQDSQLNTNTAAAPSSAGVVAPLPLQSPRQSKQFQFNTIIPQQTCQSHSLPGSAGKSTKSISHTHQYDNDASAAQQQQALLTSLLASVLSPNVLNNPLLQLATLQSVLMPQSAPTSAQQMQQYQENSLFFENLLFQAMQQSSQIGATNQYTR